MSGISDRATLRISAPCWRPSLTWHHPWCYRRSLCRFSLNLMRSSLAYGQTGRLAAQVSEEGHGGTFSDTWRLRKLTSFMKRFLWVKHFCPLNTSLYYVAYFLMLSLLLFHAEAHFCVLFFNTYGFLLIFNESATRPIQPIYCNVYVSICYLSVPSVGDRNWKIWRLLVIFFLV